MENDKLHKEIEPFNDISIYETENFAVAVPRYHIYQEQMEDIYG